jgi:hypothetical protein
LNELRRGIVSAQSLRLLAECEGREFPPGITPTLLFTTNERVGLWLFSPLPRLKLSATDSTNDRLLNELDTEGKIFTAKDRGTVSAFSRKSHLIPSS